MEDFADLISIDLDTDSKKLVAVKPTLVIFMQDDLPVASQWLEKGEMAALPARRPLADIAPASAGLLPSATVSVVICTRDRPSELRRCLASFANQTVRPGEVIVVDNASRTDETRDVALAAGATYVREDRPGLDFARNSGALAATGAFILYTDDDTELHDRWIENMVAAFGDDEEVMAVTGLVLPASLKTEAQWLFEIQWSFGRGFKRIDFGPAFYEETRGKGCPAGDVGAGANMAFRREAFDRVGLFDPRLDVGQAGCSGDSEYWYRLMAAGHICRYEPTAVVWHHHRQTMDGLESQIYHYMRGHVAALMVQYERTGDLGNLRRLFLAIPFHYLRLAASRLKNGARPRNRLIKQQIGGAIAGLIFYLRQPRPTNAR